MQRRQNAERAGWEFAVRAEGLVYLWTEGPTGQKFSYWTEGAHYSLTASERRMLRKACSELQAMFIAAGDYIIEKNLFAKLGIPAWAVPAIKRSWEDNDPLIYWPSFYGRFDIRWGGESYAGTAADPSFEYPKLLEYNADTPTSFPESCWVQWSWLQGKPGGQWNEMFGALKAAWKRNIELYERRSGRKVNTIHCTWSSHDESGEDYMNVAWVAAAAQEMGYEVKLLPIESIQFRAVDDAYEYLDETTRAQKGYFYDADGVPIHVIFKLYPWELMFQSEWGPSIALNILQRYGTVWIEPPYKVMWSNKGILAVLWELYKDDPIRSRYLLPAYFEGEQPAGFVSYARKPLLGREGANVTLVKDGVAITQTDGVYGAEGYVLQQLAPLPAFADATGQPCYPVLGVWMIDNDGDLSLEDGGPAGLGIRESSGLVTDNQSRFVPHVIVQN